MDEPVLSTFVTDEAPEGVLAQARAILDDVFDGEFTGDDWDHGLGGRHVVLLEPGTGRVLSHGSVVPRRMEFGPHGSARSVDLGYVEGVGTLRSCQGQGFASRVMAQIERIVREHYVMGALSTSRPTFYTRLGWEPWQGPTYVRTAEALVRTPDEDDGVMVLRFGTSLDVDLTAPITCEERVGDDW